MDKRNTVIITIVAAVVLIVIFFGYSNMSKKVVYEYEPVQIEDIDENQGMCQTNNRKYKN